ncbi:hypothetical protein MXD61_12370 [Frankia sp. AgPm24]|uniref:hypothetical protein n=1 Tax=Frankia sp. AgPm24 TaxID=631128 RepID=UPI00200F4892|nr:hypothetical protein [Frankia sp. AgPm24]MCK9922656.1 hypothetical protein [Frankia sp. AgPm24]
MKQGVLDEDGQVRCPKCRSVSFRTKRSFKAKAGIGIAGVATLGVGGAAGALAAPKRIKCLACGELFKARAQPESRPAPSLSSRPVSTTGPASKPRPERTPAVPREPRKLLQLPPPSTDPNEPRGTLLLTVALRWPSTTKAIREVRPDLTVEEAKALIRASKRRSPQPLLVDRPMSELVAIRKALRKAGPLSRIVQAEAGAADDMGSGLP